MAFLVTSAPMAIAVATAPSFVGLALDVSLLTDGLAGSIAHRGVSVSARGLGLRLLWLRVGPCQGRQLQPPPQSSGR